MRESSGEKPLLDEDRIHMEDIGNGLLILGGLFFPLFFLLVISQILYAESGWQTWGIPSLFLGTMPIMGGMMIIGLLLRTVAASSWGKE